MGRQPRHYTAVVALGALTIALPLARSQGLHAVTRRTVMAPAVGFLAAPVQPTGAAPAQSLAARAVPPLRPAAAPRRSPRVDSAQLAARRAFADQRRLAYQRRRAAEGSAQAQFDLGVRYLHGRGVAKDEERARALLEKAATHNHPASRSLLRQLAAKSADRRDAAAPRALSPSLASPIED